MTPHEWIVNGEVGISSKTIWAVMMGVVSGGPLSCGGKYDIPHDPSDFNRCRKLIDTIPEWYDRLQEVADVFPKWQPIVDSWDEMVKMYDAEAPTGKCHNLYEFQKGMRDKCMELDGWKKTGKWSWKRDNESSFHSEAK